MRTSDITNSFQRAADFVRLWGESALPDGRTVEDLLTLEGISLWNVISPMLAFGHISSILSKPPQQSAARNYCRTRFQKAKLLAFDASVSIAARRKRITYQPFHNGFLFLGFSQYIYRETLEPVAIRLARRPDSAVIILEDLFPLQSRKIEDDGLIFQSLWEYWDAGAANIRRELRNALQMAVAYLVMPSALPAIIESNGLPWLNVKHVFDWLFGAYLPRLLSYTAIALHIMEHCRPILLISPDVNDPRTRIFCLVGRLVGVQTLEVQFGFYGINDIEWRFFMADHLAVTGESNREIMLAHGIPQEKMTVTGSPRYDQACSCPQEIITETRKNVGVRTGNVMVLFASQPYYYGAFSGAEIRREMITALFRAASEMDKLTLVVKPHPLEDPAELADLAKVGRNIFFADKLSDIRDLIRATDVFVTFFSGTTFDALVMNKPTINLAFPGACANNLFEQCGATFVTRNAADILKVLRSINNGQLTSLVDDLAPARERFLEQWFYRLDGCAGERIEAIALKMASQIPPEEL